MDKICNAKHFFITDKHNLIISLAIMTLSKPIDLKNFTSYNSNNLF